MMDSADAVGRAAARAEAAAAQLRERDEAPARVVSALDAAAQQLRSLRVRLAAGRADAQSR